MKATAEKVINVTRLSAYKYRSMGTMCLDDDVVMLDKIHRLFDRDITYRLNHVCVSLVLRGEGDFLIDGIVHHVRPNDMFVIIQQQEVKCLRITEDFEARVLLMSRAYIEYLDIKNSYQMFLKVRRDPIAHLEGDSLIALGTCFDIISTTLRQTNNPYIKQTIYHVIKGYFYGFAYFLQPYDGEPKNREESIALRFHELLDEHYTEQHSVNYYASRLYLTPKYISACVKSVSGQTAIEIIGEKLMQVARKSLQNSNKTISEISYELGFSNQSAFGRFFRKHEGVGPKEYRKNSKSQSAQATVQQPDNQN